MVQTSATLADMNDLATRVQSLPAELYNRILDYTLTLPDTVTIDDDYIPQVQLQINRFLRRIIAAKYYLNTIFVARNPGHAAEWLNSLDYDHIGYIREIRYQITRAARFRHVLRARIESGGYMVSLQDDLARAGVSIDSRYLFVNVRMKDGVEFWSNRPEILGP